MRRRDVWPLGLAFAGLVSCGAEEPAEPRVDIEGVVAGRSLDGAMAIAFEKNDAGSTWYWVFVHSGDAKTRCNGPEGMTSAKVPDVELRFHAGSAGRDPAGRWQDFTNGASRIADARGGSARVREVTGDRVAVELDLTFDSGSLRGDVVAVICR